MFRQHSLTAYGLAFVLMFSLIAGPVQAQVQVQPGSAATASPKPTAPDLSGNYKIGAGDVILIRVFGHPELGREAPVSSTGYIKLPFFDEIKASCLTENALALVIADKLKKYLKDPQVDVAVKEYRSQPVAVIGAVTHPGRFLLQRRVRLLELLTYAGGPAQNAGSTVFVIHDNDLASCEGPPPEAPALSLNAGPGELDAEVKAVLSSFKLKELLSGSPEANLYVQPGDIVSIPDADQVFITGGVLRPGAIPLRSALTLLTAIAIAGGFNGEASKKNVQVIRQDRTTGTRSEIVVNVEDIEKRKAEDPVLLANDVVNVQGSVVKSLRKSLLQIIPATVSAMPLIILP